MSQQLAEMAQKQAAIRDAIQKMAEQMGGGNTEEGKLAKQLQQLADQMDKTEEDIVNKQLTTETLKRQQEILTRLLEAEESDRKRKMDNERKSNTANEITRPLPPAIEEYLKNATQNQTFIKPFRRNWNLLQKFSRRIFTVDNLLNTVNVGRTNNETNLS